MPIYFEDEDIRISYELGGSGTAVVAFSGVGLGLGAVQVDEFKRSLSKNSAANAVIFVTDKRRSWYNDGVFDKVINGLTSVLAMVSAANVVAVGNSMGGFGAIVFASRLKCSKVLSFCPQSSVHPNIAPFENRWAEWTAKISVWTTADALSFLSDNVDYTLLFGEDDAVDALHADRFAAKQARNVRIHRVPGAGHDVASFLKSAGKLDRLIEVLVENVGEVTT